ncbi:MAG: methionine synthase [candidate division Zixibacteria bacterium]|nr:methionine synthase [candidate division Zixibacteria bacterium]
MLDTTTVGSFPKPDYLQKARTQHSVGKLSDAGLHELELQATREVIRQQEEVGLDILVHGEMERGDMTTYFAEKLVGMGISDLVRSYGNRYYRKPIVADALQRLAPMTIEMFRYAQSLTDKPVKGMLTGPYTMCDWSFNTHYESRREVVLAFARLLHDEVKDLQSAGAKYIQIDEPAISTRPEELPLAIEAMAIVTEGIAAKTISHICYGDFRTIYPLILDLPVDQLDLEFANSGYANLDIFRIPKFTKEIAFGVLDIHSHRIETVEEIVEGIKKGIDVFGVEKMTIDPDCGLKTRTTEEAFAKLRNMVTAVRQVKSELGLH